MCLPGNEAFARVLGWELSKPAIGYRSLTNLIPCTLALEASGPPRHGAYFVSEEENEKSGASYVDLVAGRGSGVCSELVHVGQQHEFKFNPG